MRAERQRSPWGMKDLESSYTLKEQIGEGVYGKVHRARDNASSDIVALKKIKSDLTSEKEGFPITALREIQILLDLQHDCIVPLREVAISDQERSVFLVFEYLEHDLNGLVESSGSGGMTEDHVRCYMKQLVDGVAFMHSKSFLHRDIKASNLLISHNGRLKIGDWGLARHYDPEATHVNYTNRVITLWYRPPELLFGAARCEDGYGTAVDVWSIGCIIAELIHHKPILPGNTEMEQMQLIFDLLGTPTEALWPGLLLEISTVVNASLGVEKLPLWDTFFTRPEDSDYSGDEDNEPAPAKKKKKTRVLRERFANFKKDALNLIDAMLVYDPSQRMTAAAAAEHPYFRWAKKPQELEALTIDSAHEWEVRTRRRSARKMSGDTKNHFLPT